MHFKILTISSFLLVFSFTSCAQSSGGNTLAALLVAAGFQTPAQTIQAPDFTLPALSAEALSLSDYRGKIVILNFWATWCPPCREEMPSMQKLYLQLKDSGLEMLAVNLQEDRQKVSRFMQDNGYTFPVPMDTTGKIGAQYGARSIPTTYLIGKDGAVLGITVGSRDWTNEKTMKLMRALLAQ